MLHPLTAIIRKEVRSALRMRPAIAAEIYFVLGTVVVLAFALPQERLSSDVVAGLVWVVLYYAAMMTVARGYVIEQERGTLRYLLIAAPVDAVYWGKLVAGSVWMLIVAIAQYAALVFVGVVAIDWEVLVVLLVSAGSIGCATSLLAAIVAAAKLRGWMFAAIALPIVLPVLLLGVESLATVVAGGHFSAVLPELGVMVLYVTIVAIVAWWLFPFIWSDI
ncbi:MAG: heme exporter protein CcmB [Bacteroidota bacterium]|nr:heme exporter protein CcmB [Candidatus Kapabacteria bacterium]MCS7303144.1 heme exporter protein CcmB [Candidatus Kapabacteria bacterium]MCX7937195.1 heme exporter protein CcmB [Chlorobiota bacterium]MDW8075720.1 heme exporter protein CcmB [Bacteroidota bacterium]MDW8272058.1 heme exporter protein CcmB [Bacteroidota bacterium]